MAQKGTNDYTIIRRWKSIRHYVRIQKRQHSNMLNVIEQVVSLIILILYKRCFDSTREQLQSLSLSKIVQKKKDNTNYMSQTFHTKLSLKIIYE